MYAPFFGLKREPFSIAPDPRFLFMSEAHREALAHLLYGLSGGGGFVLLTGEIGAGKTTVCRCFLDQVPAHCDVAYVFNPKLGVTELLQTVCDEFHITVPPGTSTVKGYVDALNAFLLASHAAGRHSVLIIDEAQSLSPEVLEQLRLLTNLETAERKLLQIILIGQPELRQMLARPELEQLAQRVIARYHLPALREAETAQYIRHRLAVAGLAREMPFEGRALARIHALCHGVPRRINLLADRALLGGYASGRAKVDRRIVDQAAREVFGNEPVPASRRPWPLALAALAGAAVAAGLAANWPQGASPARALPAKVAAAGSGAPGASAAAASLVTPAISAASALAAGVAAASAPAGAASSAAADVLAAALPSEPAAWRELAALWKLDLGDAEPCDAAPRQRIACFRASAALAQVRELERPVLLTLRDERDHPRYVVLTALSDRGATVQAGGRSHALSLWTLAALWRGEFATFWRPPPGWREPYGDVPPPALASWMAERLPGTAEQPLKGRVVAFQVAHGLKPDGLVGPMTLMQINRASGIDEPRLNR